MNQRFAGLNDEMNQRFAGLNDEMNQRFAGLNDVMNQRFAGLNQRMERLEQRGNAGLDNNTAVLVQVLAAMRANLSIDEKNAMFKSINSGLTVEEPLLKLLNADGAPAPAFPATKSNASTLTVNDLNALLLFYSLPGDGNRADKLSRLGQFIGFRYQSIT